jgi:hypothetical protein
MALEATGLAVAGFSNSLLALDALEASQTVKFLITGTDFEPGQPNGASLVRVARAKLPSVQALFVGPPEARPFVEDLGEFLLTPVSVCKLLRTVRVWHAAVAAENTRSKES